MTEENSVYMTLLIGGRKVHCDSDEKKYEISNSPRQPERRENPFRDCRERMLTEKFFRLTVSEFGKRNLMNYLCFALVKGESETDRLVI